jgi:hypothetical protein
MAVPVVAPFLSRVKSWQLVGLGLTGWCTLYSAAIISWNNCSVTIGNAEGGCFATAMTLAGIEARRHRKGVAIPLNPFTGVTAYQVNQAVLRLAREQSFRIEHVNQAELQCGFGVRAVGAGRTVVYETSRWEEPVIDLPHVQSTDDHRKQVCADVAVIVTLGQPDENAAAYVQTHAIQFLGRKQLEPFIEVKKPQKLDIEVIPLA